MLNSYPKPHTEFTRTSRSYISEYRPMTLSALQGSLQPNNNNYYYNYNIIINFVRNFNINITIHFNIILRNFSVIVIIIINYTYRHHKQQKQNSCNNVSPGDRVCLGNMCVDTVHKGDNDYYYYYYYKLRALI